jgi:DNA-binding NarL/FixJ family response regulator
MKCPKIILADPSGAIFSKIEGIINESYKLEYIVRSGVELLRAARDSSIEIIVTEIGLPQLDGLQVADILLGERNPAKIIVFTMQTGLDVVLQAFSAGVSGYATKNNEGAELVIALHEVLAGRTYLSPYVTKAVVRNWIEAVGSRKPRRETIPFTPRQIEVLRLVVQGKTMKEVALSLGISSRTAEVHKYQMMERLGVRTVPELIQCGIRTGIVEI